MKSTRPELLELINYVNYLIENNDQDLINTLKMIKLLINNTHAFGTGFTNYDFTGIQKVLISQFLRDQISREASEYFRNLYNNYVDLMRCDYQKPVDIMTTPLQQDLFILNTGFFKSFGNGISYHDMVKLEKLFKIFLRSAVIDFCYPETVYNHKSFMNLVLWFLLENTEPVDFLTDQGTDDIMYMIVNGTREYKNKSVVTTEQVVTHYLHYINSLTEKNVTLHKFRKYYKGKKHIDYWERILCRVILPYTIWWAKYCTEDYGYIKFINSLNEIREEKTLEKLSGKICCIFCTDFFSTEQNIEDYWINGWDDPDRNTGEEHTFYRRYNILLQNRMNCGLYYFTRVVNKKTMMNSFLHKLRNGDILEFRNCSVAPGDDICSKIFSDIFDGIPVHRISVKNENIEKINDFTKI